MDDQNDLSGLFQTEWFYVSKKSLGCAKTSYFKLLSGAQAGARWMHVPGLLGIIFQLLGKEQH